MHPLSTVKQVFKKYQVYEANLDLEFIPRTTLPQALWELDINPLFTDLEAIFKDVDQSPARDNRNDFASPISLGECSQSSFGASQSQTFGGRSTGKGRGKRSATEDGKVDLDEFKTLYLMLYREYATNPQRAMQAFIQLDMNGNGVISGEDLESSLNDGRIDKLTEDEFSAFWKSLDLDGSGEVEAAKFVVALCPDITADELNAMLIAYGLEPNAHLYVKFRKTAKQKREEKERLAALAEERRLQQEQEEREETERLAREEEEARMREEEEERRRKAQEEEERRKKEQAEREEAERQRREKERLEQERKKREEAEQQKKEQAPPKEEKKEGGCCVVQ